MIFFVLGTLTLLVAIGMILVVVIQNSKGGGLSSTFGASGAATQLLGARRSSEFIEKLTWYLAGGLALLAFMANIAGNMNTGPVNTLRMGQTIEEQANFAPTSSQDLLPAAPAPADPGEGDN
jgi:preprotein translocase subunit SecG